MLLAMHEQELRKRADRLQELATVLVKLDRQVSGESEKAAHDLGRATVRFALAIRDLAEAGIGHRASLEAMFESPATPVDPLASERAELSLLSALLAGDVALDAFAWAELVRLNARPARHARTGQLPTMWPALMKRLDANPGDPMTNSARFLDVSLDAARDAIVAHRDPDLWSIRGAGTGMAFSLDLMTLSDHRTLAALNAIRHLPPPMPELPPAEISIGELRALYERRIEMLMYSAPALGSDQRIALKKALRFGGSSAPPLHEIAHRFARLVQLYLDRRRLT